MTAQHGPEQQAATSVYNLRAEHVRETLGIGMPSPRLSWMIKTTSVNWQQTAYALEVRRADGSLRGETGRIGSDHSVLVNWPFAPLESREQVTVRVRVWGNDGSESPWSEPLLLETGLLHPSDWSAQFVTPSWQEDTSVDQPSPVLRCGFVVRPNLLRARLYATALGVYEAQINGMVVGDQILAPGWTSYNHRLRVHTYDVTALLREGQNTIGATLGDGWYRGRLAWKDQRNVYGDQLALLAQLEIHYADGTTERVVTDETWKATTGPILASSLYDGETYDARLELPQWPTAGDDSGWSPVKRIERDLGTLQAPIGPPIRCTQTLAPVAIFTSPSGRTIVDFGQNVVGRVRVRVQGQAGQTLTIRHAEVLEHGELATRPLRTAKATNRYTLRGGETETWEPRFTFHGFRYVDIEGWPNEIGSGDIEARVYHSDMERTGFFACSDPLLNRFHENVVWGMRGNFLDVPTDCPQRDERLGWTGDIQVFSPAATFLYDCAGFLQSWLQDLALEQATYNGVVPHVVPNVIGTPVPAAAWGDAATVVPWALYQRFGDRTILREQYASMRAWVDVIAQVAGPTRLWDTGFQYGDWLDPSAPPENAAQARTSPAIVATAYFAYSAHLVARAAALLGETNDAEQYQTLADEVRAAFVRAYVAPDASMTSDAETAYSLALQFGLLPDEQLRSRAAQRLQQLVADGGYHIGTGFVGTPLICDALSGNGYLRDAYQLLMQRECPSWLYPVTMGATTIWERWDSLRPDGSVNPGEMTSFNHYALGAVADWVHRTIGGLAPVEPGFRQISIAPQPGGGITWAQTQHRTPYGMVECSWRITDNRFDITAVIPPNTTAHITLPDQQAQPFEVGSGTHCWSCVFPAVSP